MPIYSLVLVPSSESCGCCAATPRAALLRNGERSRLISLVTSHHSGIFHRVRTTQKVSRSTACSYRCQCRLLNGVNFLPGPLRNPTRSLHVGIRLDGPRLLTYSNTEQDPYKSHPDELIVLETDVQVQLGSNPLVQTKQ
ncbi:hypothetical protein LY78DRAFT_119337 [Colletotrichum sublineola]|nr:hypothetical protein LY78DRAFT_119337 [Colletotrichum sublineola]